LFGGVVFGAGGEVFSLHQDTKKQLHLEHLQTTPKLHSAMPNDVVVLV
jgi:hypothetical protein